MPEDLILASILDADIYERDLSLLQPGYWINDSCFNFALRRIDIKLENESLLLMDPSVLSFFVIQCEDEDEIQEFAIGTKLVSRTWIFLPVTNSGSFDEASSHWSLLLLHVPSLTYMHYDSASKCNLNAALAVASKLASIFGRTQAEVDVHEMSCPQQLNGYDCGIYTILFVEILCDFIISTDALDISNYKELLSLRMDRIATSEKATAFRMSLHQDILNMAETRRSAKRK